jgi:exopolyphosphatase/pppGpp-phosphohydrolase
MSEVDIPDFTQLAKLVSLKVVPEGSDKVAFLLARVACMVGAIGQHIRNHPEHKHEAEFIAHVEHGAHLLAQLDGGPIETSQIKFKGLLDD